MPPLVADPFGIEQVPINFEGASEILSSCTESQRQRCLELIVQKGSAAVDSYTRGWQNMAILYQQVETEIGEDKAGRFFERTFAITENEIKRWVKALQAKADPRYSDLVKRFRDPTRILGVVSQAGTTQASAKFDDERIDVDTFDPRTIGTDRLKTTPNISGKIGEDSVKAILDALGWLYANQESGQYLCDFGEKKRPDFSVRGIAARNDTTLAAGFDIEVTTRLQTSDKDLGLYYLAHQCVNNSVRPTIIVFDGPGISEKVQSWARAFAEKHYAKRNPNGGCLYWVFSIQQFREWAQVKVGRQS
jgi:hypothetical protein